MSRCRILCSYIVRAIVVELKRVQAYTSAFDLIAVVALLDCQDACMCRASTCAYACMCICMHVQSQYMCVCMHVATTAAGGP